MKRVIYTCASGKYIDYVPMFEFCAKRSYPDVDVRVDCLDNVPTQFFAACYRLLNSIDGYDRVYVTDVDMMLLPLDMGLWEYHECAMRHEGMCYSNSPRRKEFRGCERLTGLHYATQEWYEKTQNVRAHYMKMLSSGELGGDRFDDEITLMKVAKESGLQVPSPKRLISLHFGIHMGTFRNYLGRSRETINTQLRMRITPEHAKLWIEIAGDIKFDRNLAKEFGYLDSFCRRRMQE